MNQSILSYEQLIDKFVKWADTCPDIHGATYFTHYDTDDIKRGLLRQWTCFADNDGDRREIELFIPDRG